MVEFYEVELISFPCAYDLSVHNIQGLTLNVAKFYGPPLITKYNTCTRARLFFVMCCEQRLLRADAMGPAATLKIINCGKPRIK